MATKVSFVNGATTYSDEDVAQLQTDFFTEGVADQTGSNTDLQVVQRAAGANMSVDISVGRAYIDITWAGRPFKVRLANLSVINSVVGANSSGANRIDAVVAKIDVSVTPNAAGDNIGTAAVVNNATGTPAVAMSDAAITTALGHANWFRLCNITVANLAASIVNANIADTRTRPQLKNMAGVLELIEQTANPTSVANRGYIYSKDVAGRTEQFYMDDTGTVIQITSNGSLNFASAPPPAIVTLVKSGIYTATTADTGKCIECTNTFTLTLFAAATNDGKHLYVKNAGVGVITIDANASELIDGALTLVLQAKDAAHIQCDGTGWNIVDANNAEATTFFNNTAMTGTEAETLRAGATSNADLLHTHLILQRMDRSEDILERDPEASGVKLFGMTTNTLNGTASQVIDTAGRWNNYASAASTNSDAGINGTAAGVARDFAPFGVFVMKTGPVITVQRTWVGFMGGTPVTSDDPSSTRNMAFRFSTAAGDATWKCYTSDGSTSTVTNSGITVVADTKYILAIDATNPANVKFYINGALVATNTTTLPTSSTGMGPQCVTRTLENVAKSIRFSKYHCWYS